MNSYSAAEAISPAIEGTKLFLFRPFRWGTFLKLCLVAMLTEGGSGGFSSGNFNGGFPKGGNAGKFPMPHWPAMHLHWPALPILIGIAIGFVVIFVPFTIAIGYLLIRLRFAFFDCILNRQHLIAPAWRRYHRQALRYLGFMLCLGVASWIVLAIAAYAIYRHFEPLFDSLFSGGQPGFLDFLPVIAMAAPVFLGLALIAALIEIAMSTFVLPRMALEDASIPDALSDVWVDVKAEPGQFALFVVLRFVLSLVGRILGVVALVIPLVFIVGIGAVVLLLIKAVSVPLAVVLGIAAGLLVLALFFLALIGVSGTIGTFRRMYGLLFYAGRYTAMGDILQPPTVPFPPLPPSAWASNAPDPEML